MFRGDLLRFFIKSGSMIRVRCGELARLPEIIELCAFFDCQLVEREMIGSKADGFFQLFTPASIV